MTVTQQAIPPQRDGKPRPGSYSRLMLEALLANERFTGPEAFHRWGVWSVSSLVTHLRAQGWQIDSDREPETGRAIYFIRRRRRLVGRHYYRDFRLAI